MIVKTGANYQAEGGYIEASVSGDNFIIKTETKEWTVPATYKRIKITNTSNSQINLVALFDGISGSALPTCAQKYINADDFTYIFAFKDMMVKLGGAYTTSSAGCEVKTIAGVNYLHFTDEPSDVEFA